MCGIFGCISKQIDTKSCKNIVEDLYVLSESRGKEAAGGAFVINNKIKVLKAPYSASKLIRSTNFKNVLNEFLNSKSQSFSFIGHTRLVTNGDEQFEENNQPYIKSGIVGVHNGIVVNSKQLWKNHPDETKKTDLDSELIPTLFQKYFKDSKSLVTSLSNLYDEIEGVANIAVFFDAFNELLLATNNGSIYYISTPKLFLFASEEYIIRTILEKHPNIGNIEIHHLPPKDYCLVNLESLSIQSGSIEENKSDASFADKNKKATFEVVSIDPPKLGYKKKEIRQLRIPQEFETVFSKAVDKISTLPRCTTCLLPETFPFIEFDEKGECNYCKNYTKVKYLGEEELKCTINSSLPQKKIDCLIPFSGGRDSSFVLHYICKELGLRPLAYSYDWGMITDLARRNQSRMCAELGVEHILISADIRKKRANVRKNVTAWLRRPQLGTIPLFMAGDKQYFFYANQLMEQYDLKLSLLGENMLETTHFKSGFCGVKPHFGTDHTYSLTNSDKLKMIFFYGKEYLLNPSYINSSLLDTLSSFNSYYLIKHQNINVFDFLKWEENKINELLINEYSWETDSETSTTWRIGDGTAAFYNYIYLIVAGFTENDTFRSNQIREGVLDRDIALKMANEENNARWNSINWYCNTIGIDFIETIKTINNIKKLY